MINWNIFDKIYCIHYLPYKERLQNIKNELNRIGVLNNNNFEFYYTVPNKYYDFLFWDSNITSHLNLKYLNINNLNYAINSYNLMNIIYRKKYQNVLIIEDDVLFLKNISQIETIIESYPKDINVVNFEPYIWCSDKDYSKEYQNILNKDKRLNEQYIKLSNDRVIFDTGCIAFNRNFIEYYLDKQDDSFSPFDYYCRPSVNVSYCIPITHLCIQYLYNNRQDSCSECQNKYPYLYKKIYAELEHCR